MTNRQENDDILKCQKKRLLDFMNSLGFDIHDIAYMNGKEMVFKKSSDGHLACWNMEVEGSGFEQLFKGYIKKVCEGRSIK